MTGYEAYQTAEKQKRDTLVRNHLPLVYSIARHVMNATVSQSLELSDLVQSGVLGLYKALDRFDESRGVPFGSYASHYVRGAMLDEVRKTTQIPRGLREKNKRVREAFEALSQELKREPTDSEIARRLGLSDEQLGHWMTDLGWTTVWSVDDLEAGGVLDVQENSEDALPESALNKAENRSLLVQALRQLSLREQQILYAYYEEDLTLKEIAYVMDLSESQISRIHSKAIVRLRTMLAGQREDFGA